MKPYYVDASVTLFHGKSENVLPMLPGASIDAVVTDPPYEMGFMGKSWDASGIAYNVGLWREVLRLLKPGGHLLAFGGSRTVHRLTCAIEDAGFEIRDGIDWLYATGFPKSLDISKAIDKAAGAERTVVGERDRYRDGITRRNLGDRNEVYGAGLTANGVAAVTAPATDDARRWSGWGTALKPAKEPMVLARKPLIGPVVANVLTYGTGALNINGCRIGDDQRTNRPGGASSLQRVSRVEQGYRSTVTTSQGQASTVTGRWPTNVVMSHAPLVDGEAIVGDACADGCVPGCPVAELDRQSGVSTSRPGQPRTGKAGDGWRTVATGTEYADSGGASRFFPVFRYEAKAPSSERPRGADGTAHATVKPLGLKRWAVRLITPPGGTVLDLFAGSGTTGEACVIEGFRCVLVEREVEHLPLITARLSKPLQPTLDIFGGAA